MIKCIVVDDEKPARDELSYLINENESFDLIASFDSGKTLLSSEIIETTDIIFLDINMPGLNGIETAEKLHDMDIKKKIIFVTAYDEHAIKAFELNAIDYLLKPVSNERFLQSLTKIEESLSDSYGDQLSQLFNQLNHKAIEKISIHHDGKIIPIYIDDIIFIKSKDKGVLIKTLNGSYICNYKLKDLELRFIGTDIYRCHRSFMINLKLVEHIEPWFNRTYNVLLRGSNEKTPISRHYVNEFNLKMNII